MAKAEIDKFITDNSITMEVVFVPWSRSRFATAKAIASRDPRERSLNWKVTILKNGRPVIETDYMAGLGHCPSYKFNSRWTLDYTAKIEHETEYGTVSYEHGFGMKRKRVEILPKLHDVLYSLSMDASVLNYGTFEEWACDCGYEPDSRDAEKTYHACLAIALKMRAVLGESGLCELSEACQDY